MIDLSMLVKIKNTDEQESESKRYSAIEYLKQTDWYIIRKVETGQSIPDDISDKRKKARDVILNY